MSLAPSTITHKSFRIYPKNKMTIYSKQPSWALLLLVLGVALTSVSALKIPSQWVSNLSSFAAGGVGGVCSVLVGHPFDLVKVRQQTDTSKEKASRGTFETLRDIIAKEGFRGMYRGVSAPIIAVAPIFAVSFWGNDVGIMLVRHFAKLSADAPLNMLQLCLAGGFSALPTAVVMVPCERIKCLLQTQDQKSKKYNGFQDCASKLYKEAGLLGLYKGTMLTLMRDVPGNMVYFGVYEITKRYLGNSPLLAGSLAGIAFWPVILPIDTLKSRYQTAPAGTYKNIGEVYTTLMKEEGAGGLFRGIKPAMVRSAPANAVSFSGAELTKTILTKFL